MTVAELKKELEYYDDDMEVVFNLDDPSVEVDSWTEDKWGNRKAVAWMPLPIPYKEEE